MKERWHCKPGGNVWHSTSRCSQWPRLDYWSRNRMPAGGELCAECAELQRIRELRASASIS
ncbi:MAG TPA: hypothetical protein VFC33_19315 [Acidimicrobiia bacterium]|nr:hypothetical protein [Acidimicrobiia bacterium]